MISYCVTVTGVTTSGQTCICSGLLIKQGAAAGGRACGEAVMIFNTAGFKKCVRPAPRSLPP